MNKKAFILKNWKSFNVNKHILNIQANHSKY